MILIGRGPFGFYLPVYYQRRGRSFLRPFNMPPGSRDFMILSPPPSIKLSSTPTPLRKLHALSTQFPGKAIWLKCDDQSSFVLSGNKVRKLEFLLAEALSQRATAVVTVGGVQSNHCRATAFACAQLGLKCHLILRDDVDASGQQTVHRGNHFLDQLAGASCDIYASREFAQNLDGHLAQAINDLEAAGERVYVIPVGGSNGLGVWGYVRAAEEILTQCHVEGFAPDAVVCASGSGGTQAGLSLGMHVHARQVAVHGFAVCDSREYFERKIRDDVSACIQQAGLSKTEIDAIINELNIRVNDDYIGPGYAQAEPVIYQRIALLARTEGVLLDPVYTGKAMHGMLSELEKDKWRNYQNIVFVHTGGAFSNFVHEVPLRSALTEINS